MHPLWQKNKKFLDSDSQDHHFVSVDFDHHTDCSCRLIIATGRGDEYLNEDLSLYQVDTLLEVLKEAKRGIILKRKLDRLTSKTYASAEIAEAVMNSFLEQNTEVCILFEIRLRDTNVFRIEWKKR